MAGPGVNGGASRDAIRWGARLARRVRGQASPARPRSVRGPRRSRARRAPSRCGPRRARAPRSDPVEPQSAALLGPARAGGGSRRAAAPARRSGSSSRSKRSCSVGAKSARLPRRSRRHATARTAARGACRRSGRCRRLAQRRGWPGEQRQWDPRDRRVPQAAVERVRSSSRRPARPAGARRRARPAVRASAAARWRRVRCTSRCAEAATNGATGWRISATSATKRPSMRSTSYWMRSGPGIGTRRVSPMGQRDRIARPNNDSAFGRPRRGARVVVAAERRSRRTAAPTPSAVRVRPPGRRPRPIAGTRHPHVDLVEHHADRARQIRMPAQRVLDLRVPVAVLDVPLHHADAIRVRGRLRRVSGRAAPHAGQDAFESLTDIRPLGRGAQPG